MAVLSRSRLACGRHAGRSADWRRVAVACKTVTVRVDEATWSCVVKVHLFQTLLERLAFVCLCSGC